MVLPDSLRELSRTQAGMLTLEQLRNGGAGRGAIRSALERGEWSAVLPSVVCTLPAPLTDRQRLIAARLHAGAESVIASLSAAHWHGVTAAADALVHVAVPLTRHPRNAGFVVVRRTRHPDPGPWQRGPLIVASRARAVVDAARDARSPDHATAIVCEAVERRLVRADSLRHALETGPRAGSRIVRTAVEAAEAGAWSVAEVDLLALVTRSRVLPPMWLNPVLTTLDGTRLPTPDGWFDDVGLAVQVHSWRWHSGRDEWDATVMSDGVFAEYGIGLLAVTPRAVDRAPGQVLSRIERAYRSAARLPRPDVSATPQGCRRSA